MTNTFECSSRDAPIKNSAKDGAESLIAVALRMT
jgi:hypothetical protein